ncbi:MAG: MotA/TolQ/ExbB proton channel family protein [Bryobacterales bacterium]|nr:MotA/TolQ/ExbB proton channel family protein [Bryobacterales bacterium]
MDLATVVGIVLCSILILSAIVLGGSPLMFIDIPSVLIVVGGTIGATLVRNPLAAVLGVAKVVMKAFTVKLPDPAGLISEIVGLSRKARKEGMLALENVPIDYPFLKKAISLCVDGIEVAQIRAILEADINAMASRHRRGASILEGIAEIAPAFGMIGTLIGLVQMLANMSDPSSIGPAMAVALLTTLYGALIANVACIPLAGKLKLRSEEELVSMIVCLEGCIGLSQGDNPGAIEQQLMSYLGPRSDDKKDADKKEEAA